MKRCLLFLFVPFALSAQEGGVDVMHMDSFPSFVKSVTITFGYLHGKYVEDTSSQTITFDERGFWIRKQYSFTLERDTAWFEGDSVRKEASIYGDSITVKMIIRYDSLGRVI